MKIACCITAFSEHNPNDLLDIDDMAQIFEVSDRTIRRMEEEGDLPCGHKVGQKKFWISKKVIEYMEMKSEASTEKREEMFDRLKEAEGI